MKTYMQLAEALRNERDALAARVKELEGALGKILNTERHADAVAGSGMVDDVYQKAMRAMADYARKAKPPAAVAGKGAK